MAFFGHQGISAELWAETVRANADARTTNPSMKDILKSVLIVAIGTLIASAFVNKTSVGKKIAG